MDIDPNIEKLSAITTIPTINTTTLAKVEKVSTKSTIAQSSGIPIKIDNNDTNNKTLLLLLSLICFFKLGLINVIMRSSNFNILSSIHLIL